MKRDMMISHISLYAILRASICTLLVDAYVHRDSDISPLNFCHAPLLLSFSHSATKCPFLSPFFECELCSFEIVDAETSSFLNQEFRQPMYLPSKQQLTSSR